MWSPRSSVLDAPVDPLPPPASPGVRSPAIAALATLASLFVLAEWLGWTGVGVVRVAGVAAGHGTLLALALARADARWPRKAVLLVALLALAAGAARVSRVGAVLYLAVPIALARMAVREPRLASLGVCRPDDWRAMGLGVAAGAFLGAHLLVSASLTFGYRVSVVPVSAYLAALAYDVGASVPSAECFFRGALFDGLQRRWPDGIAFTLATGVAIIRYLVDPALPRAVETVAGAVLYMTLLSVTSCALFRWSGSVLPGAVAGLCFFGAYRALAGWS